MIGFVIFGWPKRQKVVGSASPGFCDHCQNQTMWSHLKTRRWITLYFIPVIPLERANHWLVCDVCGAGVEMDKAEARASKEMIENTKRRASGELREEEYYEYVDSFAAEFMADESREDVMEAEVIEEV